MIKSRRYKKGKTSIGYEGLNKQKGSWCHALLGEVDGQKYISIDSVNTPCLTVNSARDFANAILELIKENTDVQEAI